MLRLRIFVTCLFLLVLTVLANTAEDQPAKDQQGDPLPTGAVARLGTVRWRQGDRVAFAAFLPDGKSVVSVGDDQTIRVWDYPSGKQLRQIDLSTEEKSLDNSDLIFAAAAVAGNGKTIATFFNSRSGSRRAPDIRLHDLSTGKELPGLKVDTSGVTALAFSPDSQELAAMTSRGMVYIGDWTKARLVRKFNDANESFPSTGSKILYSADGKLLVTLHSQFLSLWDPTTGTKMRSITNPARTRPRSPSSQLLSSCALSTDGKTLAFSTTDHFITLVETNSGKEIRKLSFEPLDAQTLLFSKDGSKLYALSSHSRLSTDGNHDVLREWDLATGKVLRQFDTGPQALARVARNMAVLSLAPDGETVLIAGYRNSLQFFDLRAGKEIVSSSSSGVALQSLQFTPDGKNLLTLSDNGTARKWEAATGKDLGLLNLPEQLVSAVSPDGKLLAAQLSDGRNVVTLIDTATGKAISELPLKERESSLRILFAPNSKMMAVRTFVEEKLELYEVPSSKLLHTLDIKTGVPQQAKGPGGRGGGGATVRAPQTLIFSADSQTLASYSTPTTLSLWNVATGERRGSLALSEGNPVQSGAFSADGRSLALARNDGVVTVYELATCQPRRSYGKKPAPPEVTDDDDPRISVRYFAEELASGVRVAFSPDSKALAHAGLDRLVHVWDLTTGTEKAAFKGHTGALTAVAFAPDGKTLASASADTTALVWDMTKVQNPAPPMKALSPDDLKTAWQALAGDDATKAFTAICDLAAAPKETVPFLKDQVKPATPFDKKRVQELIRQLDADQPATRQKASSELLELGEQLVPTIDETLATNPPLEVRNRLRTLRDKFTDPILKGDRLRLVRAVEVLERIGTPEARQVLQTLATGAPSALVTKNAEAALKR